MRVLLERELDSVLRGLKTRSAAPARGRCSASDARPPQRQRHTVIHPQTGLLYDSEVGMVFEQRNSPPKPVTLQMSRPRTSRTDHKPSRVLPIVDLATGRMPLDISDYEIWKAEPNLALFPVPAAMIAQERERRSRSCEPRAGHQCMSPAFLIKPASPPRPSQHVSSAPTCGGNDAAEARLAPFDRPARVTRASNHMKLTQSTNSPKRAQTSAKWELTMPPPWHDTRHQ
jgi:hypothetical protein